ncbi:hypothetical protein FPSE_05828 [Fusarium pseudograminearum CS3096]|uniref:Uncharacterized protein n=1 Tax=Fusarium pseudograminearum (strain CS3096) TaxID=1028729 RepID=K3W0E0_FUSPC|nr:hypothetical protein FPSE_05828 [Fusarium pseudograminearum CS3096]EKJ73985.1 hypothetical protein FPSE_05828 [Fusarium pseudograminearum CS3096]
MSDVASERMGKKNVVFTKDGVKVGVKQVKTENYVDATQSWFVKAWNLGTAQDGSQALRGHCMSEIQYLNALQLKRRRDHVHS